MKYKIGDKVKIRSWADMEQDYGLYKSGDIKFPLLFSKERKPWCNKVVTIKKINANSYIIKKDNYRWSWADVMIDHAATKVISIIDRLEILKKLTNNKGIKIDIDKDIKRLKSDSPSFFKGNVNYYNNIFRKLKGKK